MVFNPPPGIEPLRSHPRYTKIADLNRGSYGFVQLARDNATGEEVAIKFIQRGEKMAGRYVEREIVNHSMLLHPHIIQFKEVFLTPEYLAISMEYAKGGDMFQYVKAKGGLQEHEARWFFQQLIIALDYAHRMNVVSRDIKLENTLLDGSRRPLLKICDFGYSKNTEKDSVPKSRVGTPGYTAPEVISQGNTGNYDGKAVDVWACGVMLFVMLFCQYPFERPEDEQEKIQTKRYQMQLQRVIRGDYRVPSRVKIGDSCRELLGRILQVDVAKRITIPEILKHKWFLTDLPKGLDSFNDICMEQQADSHVLEDNKKHVASIVQRSQDGRGLQGRPSKSAVAAAQEAKQGPGPGAQVNGEASLDHDTDDYTDYMDQDSMEYHQSAEGPAAKK